MIKLVSVSIFIVPGALIGCVFFKLFASNKVSMSLCIGLGVPRSLRGRMSATANAP